MPDDTLLAGRLFPGGHELLQRVYFEDTDFSGRVYHARYLHFLERGRSDFLRLLGIHHRVLAKDGATFAVRRISVDFRRAATIDDILVIRTSCQDVGGARVKLAQAVSRDGADLVRATVEVVLIGPKGRPLRLPEAMRAAFARP